MIRARAPLRLGLAGGGTDVSPYNEKYGGRVLNATIDKYAYAFVEERREGVEFASPDRERSGDSDVDAVGDLAADFGLHVSVYRRMMEQFHDGRPLPLRLSTQVDAPPGSGLGSSSALVVAMVLALAEHLEVALGSYEIARLAWEIERIDLGLAGVWQDHYAATFGGFNYSEYRADGRVVVNPLRIRRDMVSELEASILLYFGGVARDSAGVIDDQRRNVESGLLDALAANHAVRAEAESMKDHLLLGDFAGFVESMRKGWEAKKRLSAQVETPEIERAHDVAAAHGMLAGKVSGAGGGGFMLLVVDPGRRLEVSRSLEQECGGIVMTCHFTEIGAEVWRSPGHER